MKKPGFVYVMAAGGLCRGLYKIGKSANPKQRLKEISVSPFPVSILHTIPCKDMAKVESGLHRTYAEHRESGEWFKLDGAQLSILSDCNTETEILAIIKDADNTAKQAHGIEENAKNKTVPVNLTDFTEIADSMKEKVSQKAWKALEMTASERKVEVAIAQSELKLADEIIRECCGSGKYSKTQYKSSIKNEAKRLDYHCKRWLSILENKGGNPSSFIYFAQSNDGWLKIGASSDVEKRIHYLESLYKTQLVLLGVRDGGAQQESSIHYNFRDDHFDKGWFFPSPRLMEFVRTHVRPIPIATTIRPDRKGKKFGQPNQSKTEAKR